MEYQANTRSIGQVKEFNNQGLKRNSPTTLAFLEALDALRVVPEVDIKNWGKEFGSAVSLDGRHYLTLKGEKRIGEKMEKDEIVLAVSRGNEFSIDLTSNTDVETAQFWLNKKAGKGQYVDITELGNRPEIWRMIKEVGNLVYFAVYVPNSRHIQLLNSVPDLHFPNLSHAYRLQFKVNFNKGEKIARTIQLPRLTVVSGELALDGVEEVYAPLLEISDDVSKTVDLRLKNVKLIECKKIGKGCRLFISTQKGTYHGLSVVCPLPITNNISLGASYFTDTHEEYDAAQGCFVFPGVKGLRRFVSRKEYDNWLLKGPPEVLSPDFDDES
jgi:hypothetical protein